jgi:hypothetical protein
MREKKRLVELPSLRVNVLMGDWSMSVEREG